MIDKELYIKIDEIKRIQLDHTSRCNLFCPQCTRTINKNYPIADLSVDDYSLMLEPFEKNKITLFHCGNYGDAIASPTFDETFEHCLNLKVQRIKIVTNGSLRSSEWWKELALKSTEKLTVVFSIDGLLDTNHIYRVGSNFTKIMENAKSFIDNGGDAEWAFIEFNHNYHQIEEARKISREMGFRHFSVKYTARFADKDITKIKNRNNMIVEDVLTNQNRTDKENIIKRYERFDEYVMNTPISCKFQKEKSVFIDMNMNLWPCCWFGAPPYFEYDSEQKKSFDHFFNLYGNDFNNLRKHGWSILNHEFYTKYLSESWNSPGEKFKRIYTCGRTCGSGFEYSSGYGKNYKKEKLNDG